MGISSILSRPLTGVFLLLEFDAGERSNDAVATDSVFPSARFPRGTSTSSITVESARA